MFDKINGPSNPMAGPAQGHSTEQGDSWHTAVAKINAGFKNIVRAIEGGFAPGAPDDVALGERLSHFEDALAALQIKFDALTTPASTPPVLAEPAAPAPADPAPIAAAIPVTSASTYIGAGGPANPAA